MFLKIVFSVISISFIFEIDSIQSVCVKSEAEIAFTEFLQQFSRTYNISYTTYDYDEYQYRFKVFSDNLKLINQHNAENVGGTVLGITQYTDRVSIITYLF